MSEELLIRHCAPTLAGIKTANMFTWRCGSADELRAALRIWNSLLKQKGLRILPLKYDGERALIYIFRPTHLKKDLERKEARDILSASGYSVLRPEACMLELIRRIERHGDFPHEIGLFLGYPPEDVLGFIENRAENCKCVGCWKVYGDVAAAKATFGRFKRCTEIYRKLHAAGASVRRLAVAD